jgi:uncharacterized protein YukE
MNVAVSVDTSELDGLRRRYLHGADRLAGSSSDTFAEFDDSSFGDSAEGVTAAQIYAATQQQLSHSSKHMCRLIEDRAEAIRQTSAMYSDIEANNLKLAQLVSRVTDL